MYSVDTQHNTTILLCDTKLNKNIHNIYHWIKSHTKNSTEHGFLFLFDNPIRVESYSRVPTSQ